MRALCLSPLIILFFGLISNGGTDLFGSQPVRTQEVHSPEFQPDHSIVFRVFAPRAKQVFLLRDGLAKVAMIKGSDGVWTVKTTPLDPDVYTYQFSVDGLVQADLANPKSKPLYMGGSESILHIAGPKSLPWETNDVPHGALHKLMFTSKIIGETRDLWVYTPPGYDQKADIEYPVLYLLHGVTENGEVWTSSGRAQVILDNLIARREAKPMILVMPLGYGFADPRKNMNLQFGSQSSQTKIMATFSKSLLDEIVPFVDAHFRTKRDSKSRAIAGVSMGGQQSLAIGLNHLDQFGWIGSFSGALVMLGAPFEKWLPTVSSKSNRELHLLFVGCGKDDFLFTFHKRFKDWLTARQIRFTSHDIPGGHNWPVWRRDLTVFAPLLFRD